MEQREHADRDDDVMQQRDNRLPGTVDRIAVVARVTLDVEDGLLGDVPFGRERNVLGRRRVVILGGSEGVLGEFLKSRGDGRLVEAATVLLPPVRRKV